jgi:hypothetical protein
MIDFNNLLVHMDFWFQLYFFWYYIGTIFILVAGTTCFGGLFWFIVSLLRRYSNER